LGFSRGRGREVIVGTGVDLVSVARIERTLGRWGEQFLRRIYVREEIEYCQMRRKSARHLAARFAAKEAVRKALGDPRESAPGWKEIVVLNDESGLPRVKLRGTARAAAERKKAGDIFLSMSHDGDYAVAQVVLEGGRG